MLIQFQSTRSAADPIWVNPENVTHVEQIGSNKQRTKVYFVGGSSAEVAGEPTSVAAKISGKRDAQFG
jgi:hypothetical protein